MTVNDEKIASHCVAFPIEVTLNCFNWLIDSLLNLGFYYSRLCRCPFEMNFLMKFKNETHAVIYIMLIAMGVTFQSNGIIKTQAYYSISLEYFRSTWWNGLVEPVYILIAFRDIIFKLHNHQKFILWKSTRFVNS